MSKPYTYLEYVIERLETLEPAAARYLKEADLPYVRFAESLAGLFIWANTPQGVDYWAGIDQLINSQDGYYTAVLAYPDYMTDDIEAFIQSARADTPFNAARLVQWQACVVNEAAEADPQDFRVLAVFKGDLSTVLGTHTFEEQWHERARS